MKNKNDPYLIGGIKEIKKEFNNLESFAKNVFIIRYFTFIHPRIIEWLTILRICSNTPDGKCFVDKYLIEKIENNQREELLEFINSIFLEQKIPHSVFSEDKDYTHDIMVSGMKKHEAVGPATIIYLHESLSAFIFESSNIKNERRKENLTSTQIWAFMDKRNSRLNSLLKIIEDEAAFCQKSSLKIKEAHASFGKIVNDFIKNLS